MIYEIRGKQVMLDSDLAHLYRCKNGTKTINLAVKRNIERFPEDFYFQLTSDEYRNLKFQFETSSLESHGGVRKLPYVFTEQGVAMLATVIKTDVASYISVQIMRAFVAMRHYIGNSDYRLSNVETKLIEYDNSIIYHCGASINRIGYKTFSINSISDKEVCSILMKKINKIIVDLNKK